MSEDEQMHIEYVPIDSVHTWDKNPKEHDMDAILASFKRFGPRKPITVQKGTRMVIAGHGRLEAFKQLGFDTIPIIEQDMSDEDARAFALVDNQTTIKGGWDDELLSEDLKELQDELPELDMAEMGFEEYNLNAAQGENDPNEAWAGMPECTSEEMEGKTLIVHFRDQGAVQQFSTLIGQPITDKTKYIWFPEQERVSYQAEGYQGQ